MRVQSSWVFDGMHFLVSFLLFIMFSATGTMNLQANLTPGEIIEQVLHASRVTTLRGLVFMGIALDFFNLRNGRTAG